MTTYTSNMNANIAFHALITTHNITHVRITNTRSDRSREIPVAGLDRRALAHATVKRIACVGLWLANGRK